MNINFRKTSLHLALIAASSTFVACSGEGVNTNSTVETVNNAAVSEISAPTGMVMGVVQDTNGMPISGAKVTVAGMAAVTTDAAGGYSIADVVVSQAKDSDDLDGNNPSINPISITITPPATTDTTNNPDALSYLSMTVTVEPTAQAIKAEGSEQSQILFVDGFSVSAGTAVLPALTSSAQAVLMDFTTEEVIAGANVTLEVQSVYGDSATPDVNGVKVTYNTNRFTAVSGAAGELAFTGLPEDTNLLLKVENHTVNVGGSFTTEDAGFEQYLGEVKVSETVISDDTSPFVEKVTQVINQAVAPGMLNDDVFVIDAATANFVAGTTIINIEVSEAFADISADNNSVKVYNATAKQAIAGVTLTQTGNMIALELPLTAAIEAGDELDIFLLKADIRDTSENNNIIAAGGAVGFDSNVTTTDGTEYLKLSLKLFKEANLAAPAVSFTAYSVGATAASQQYTDEMGMNDIELVQAATDALKDVDDNENGIQQLNAVGSDTPLTAYSQALANSLNLPDTATVNVDVALVHVTPTAAAYFEIDILDSNGVSKYVFNNITLKDGGELSNLGSVGRIDVGDEDEGDLILLLENVQPGDQVSITPYDDFGYDGTEAILELADNVAPAITLQSAYGTSNVADNLKYGQGGEQAALGNVSVGTPILNLTPRLMGLVDGTNDGPNDVAAEVNSFDALYALNSVSANSATGTNVGEQFIAESSNIYDANAISAYIATDLSKTIGVEISEAVTLVPAETIEFVKSDSSAATVVPSNFTVNSDVVLDDNGDAVSVQLVQFDVNNIYNFALQEHGSVFDFSGAIADSTGNLAGLDEKLVVQDLIPALVLSAVYDGNNFVVTFDKAIDLSNAPSLDLNGLSIDLSDASDYTLAGNVLTVKPAAWGGDTNLADITTTFNLAQYNESDLSVAVLNSQYSHAALDFSEVQSANGAAWDDYSMVGTENYWEAPKFAATNLVETFQVAGSGTFTDATVTLTYAPKHKVDFTNVGDTNADGVLDAAELLLMHNMVAATATSITAATFTETEAANGAYTYTFVLTLDAIATSTDTFTLNLPNWDSAYDQTTTNVGVITLP